MSTFAITIYVLMWPLIVFGVMSVIGYAFFADWKKSHDSGEDII